MNKLNILTGLKVYGVPTLYALGVRLFFGVSTWSDLFSIMSITFLFCAPAIVGALVVYFSEMDRVQKLYYRILAPWLPVFIFMGLTLMLWIEGWACWVMVLPLFLIAASLGGLIGGYFKLRKKDNTLYVSTLVLLPLVIAPLESMVGRIPGTYRADTSIDIQGTRAKIWENITRVKAIPKQQDKGWLTRSLGFPRPVRAELNFNGVGAYRKAIFTNGLVFHETVLEYRDQEKMVFSIKANPHEIPSTTMDEHVVIGGDYFDVLNGTYELEQLDKNTYRVHLYSRFKLDTTFNFYASWWARWIMQDIQNNILQVIKGRAEEKFVN